MTNSHCKTNEHTEQGLYYREWTIENPKAVVLLVHGLGEHCQRYDALASYLNRAGYTVSSMDLPNHGRSDGQYGDIASFEAFEHAILGLYQRIQKQSPNKPLFLLGHSMGGLISTHLLMNHQAKFSGALLSGPAIENPQEPPAWQVKLISFIANVFPKAGMLELDGNLVSRDPNVVKQYFDDPLVSDKKLSARLLLALFSAMANVKENAHRITLPLLIMHGTADQLTAPSGSQWLHDHVASQDKTLRFYDGLFHEIFNEPEALDIYANVVEWLDNRIT